MNNQIELTLEAKSAIRRYMLFLVTLPSVFIAVIGFLLGFAIKDYAVDQAHKEAYTKSYDQAQSTIHQLTTKAFDSVSKAETSRSRAEITLKEVESIREKLKTVEAFQNSEKIVVDVVNSLSTRDDFQSSVTNKVLKDVNSESDKIKKKLHGLDAKIVSIDSTLSNTVKYNENINLNSANGTLHPNGGGRSEKHVILIGDPQLPWQIAKY